MTVLQELVTKERRGAVAGVLSLDEVPAALANLAGTGPPGKQVIAVAARPGLFSDARPTRRWEPRAGMYEERS